MELIKNEAFVYTSAALIAFLALMTVTLRGCELAHNSLDQCIRQTNLPLECERAIFH